ncbi:MULTISPECIES: GNAT family N-acetyltransferase [unclassified Streptomyces]|uniref:GNAT family N-acetyltransferase n=1 Tax=unclassified Streptomyces TaxID=2593676 RepID=UPI002E2AD3D3|nr:GNAT family N-acetyltransferase [Streptomyces sp. NBC_00223]
MAVIIRDYAAADAAAVSALMRETLPHLVTTPQVVHAQVTGAPARQHYRLLIAEDSGVMTGCARIGLFADTGTPGRAFLNLNVLPAGRRRGTGSALLAAAEAHLSAVGATTAYSWATDEPAAHTFATRHGYRPGRSASFHRLDLGSGSPLPDRPAPAEGVRLLPASLWADDPRPLYESDLESFRDEPGDVESDAISYPDWRALTWDRPDFDPDLSTAAVVDGTVAAFVVAQTDGRERYWSGGTGTRTAYRGRGLAKAAKAHSLHLARTVGCREAYTSNDDGNLAMLAVNRWLGYQPCGSERRYFRDLPDHP